ncbi:MAG: Rha family transcriptional regulator [Desulfovibrio sp.]
MAQAILSEPASTGNGLPGAMPILSLVNGHPRASSVAVAEHFKKRHDNVLRSITQTCHALPADFCALNFEETSATVPGPKGGSRQERAYLMTRDGFTLIVMGFTGKEAMAWKLRYIEAFNAMEAEISRQQAPAASPATLSTSSRLSVQNLIAAKVSHYPSELRPKAFKEAWARVKNKFRVAKYEDIPEATYQDVVSYILAMEMKLALPAGEGSKAVQTLPNPEPVVSKTAGITREIEWRLGRLREAKQEMAAHSMAIYQEIQRGIRPGLVRVGAFDYQAVVQMSFSADELFHGLDRQILAIEHMGQAALQVAAMLAGRV